jgi:UDP-N-acetylglucosamine--dolichyl-phosphate N-acetylglucosaminephosphotransferase
LLLVTTFFIALIGFVDHFRNIRPYPKFVYCTIVGALFAYVFLSDPAYPVWYGIVAAGVIGVSYSVLVNAFNVLAGFNGLESGITVISSVTLAIYFALHGFMHEAGILLLVAVSYAVFYQLNKYPAQMFIGNSGTLVPPSIFVGLAVVTHQWIPVLFVTAPHLINIVIKYASTGVSSRSDHKPLVYKDGLLHLPPGGYLSLIRLYLKSGPKHEKQLVRYVYSIELLFCILLFVVA